MFVAANTLLIDIVSSCVGEACWNGEEQYCMKAVHTGLMATGSYQEFVTR